MSRQKCMSYSKCSDSEANSVTYFNFLVRERKFQTMMSNQQNVKNEAFKVDLTLLKIKLIKNFKLKINLTQFSYKICRIFSVSKHRLNFENPSTGSREISFDRRDLFQLCFQFQRKTQKTGQY